MTQYRSKFPTKSLFAATAVAALLTATAFAGGGRHDGGGMHDRGPPMDGMGGMGMHPGMLDRMADELSLSDAQRQTIRGLFESARPAMQANRDEMRKNAELLRNTEPGDKDYQAVVERASRAAGELAARAVSDGAQLRARVWAVLTPEQRVKAREMGNKMRDRMAERRAERMNRRHEGRPPQGGTPPAPPSP